MSVIASVFLVNVVVLARPLADHPPVPRPVRPVRPVRPTGRPFASLFASTVPGEVLGPQTDKPYGGCKLTFHIIFVWFLGCAECFLFFLNLVFELINNGQVGSASAGGAGTGSVTADGVATGQGTAEAQAGPGENKSILKVGSLFV